jgi:hypothetical protein
VEWLLVATTSNAQRLKYWAAAQGQMQKSLCPTMRHLLAICPAMRHLARRPIATHLTSLRHRHLAHHTAMDHLSRRHLALFDK